MTSIWGDYIRTGIISPFVSGIFLARVILTIPLLLGLEANMLI
jgi:hypothetical protein